jgi:hypothetical protein
MTLYRIINTDGETVYINLDSILSIKYGRFGKEELDCYTVWFANKAASIAIHSEELKKLLTVLTVSMAEFPLKDNQDRQPVLYSINSNPHSIYFIPQEITVNTGTNITEVDKQENIAMDTDESTTQEISEEYRTDIYDRCYAALNRYFYSEINPKVYENVIYPNRFVSTDSWEDFCAIMWQKFHIRMSENKILIKQIFLDWLKFIRDVCFNYTDGFCEINMGNLVKKSSQIAEQMQPDFASDIKDKLFKIYNQALLKICQSDVNSYINERDSSECFIVRSWDNISKATWIQTYPVQNTAVSAQVEIFNEWGKKYRKQNDKFCLINLKELEENENINDKSSSQ